MGILPVFFNPRDKSASTEARGKKTTEGSEPPPSGNPKITKTVASEDPSHDPPRAPLTADEPSPVSKPHDSDASPAATPEQDTPPRANSTPDTTPRRWSIRSPFGLLGKRKPEPSPPNIGVDAASNPATDQVKRENLTPADHQAKQSALVVRSLIVGQEAVGGGFATPPQGPISRSQLNNIKAELLQSETANKVIEQLKALPALATSALQKSTPIHAVCLPYTDEEVENKHFSLLLHDVEPTVEHAIKLSSVASATIDSVAETFKNLQVVNLFEHLDTSSGHPGNDHAKGLLAEAVPVAETVINGISRVIPQLMTLSYATGKDVVPDHTGIHPPTDRISVLTYWWGLEILLPPPTLAHLSRVQSISNTVMNFLTALSVMSGGVSEILPLVRCISQFIDFEFNTIKAQDHGKGVICAATWIMPAAIIPRPWDFPDPPEHVEPPAHTPSDAKAPSTEPVSTVVPGQT